MGELCHPIPCLAWWLPSLCPSTAHTPIPPSGPCSPANNEKRQAPQGLACQPPPPTECPPPPRAVTGNSEFQLPFHGRGSGEAGRPGPHLTALVITVTTVSANRDVISTLCTCQSLCSHTPLWRRKLGGWGAWCPTHIPFSTLLRKADDSDACSPLPPILPKGVEPQVPAVETALTGHTGSPVPRCHPSPLIPSSPK